MLVPIASALLFSLALRIEAVKFNPLHHSGPASPYFDAPSRYAIDSESVAPDGCVVDQAAYIVRHGSRYPEPGSLKGWQALYTKVQNASFEAYGPLRFLGSWTIPVDDVTHMSHPEGAFLSTTGAAEAFQLGADLRKRYAFTKGGENFTVWSAGQQRCVDTATFFLRGYLSQGNYENSTHSNRGSIITLPDSAEDAYFADSLTPSSSCPAYAIAANGSAVSEAYRSTFRQGIADRLNTYLKGDLIINTTDIGVMQDLCGFGTQISGWRAQAFCDMFTEQEWLDYEYAHDLNYYYGSGPGNPISATVGYPWVKAITDIFNAGPDSTVNGGDNTPPPLIMGFTHDNNIPPILSALGLWNATILDPMTRNAEREFRASHVVSFRGYVAMERLTCTATTVHSWEPIQHVAANVLNAGTPANVNASTKQYVRIRVNNAPVPIPGCDDGPGRTCALGGFVKHVRERGVVAGRFADRCGFEVGVERGDGVNTDEVRFLSGDEGYVRTVVGVN